MEAGGELEKQAETMEKLTRYMPLCFFVIVVLLVWQFNSFRRPLIIFITIPLAFVGAFMGLIVMRAPFDFFGMLGLLSLAGVIIKQSDDGPLERTFLRADTFPSRDEAIEFSVRKAKQIIDEQGARLFASGEPSGRA